MIWERNVQNEFLACFIRNREEKNTDVLCIFMSQRAIIQVRYYSNVTPNANQSKSSVNRVTLNVQNIFTESLESIQTVSNDKVIKI